MKQSILIKSIEETKRELKLGRIVSIALIILALGLNLLFTLLTDDDSLTLFLVLNIAVDIVIGMGVYLYYILKMETPKKLLRLFSKERESISGVIDEVGERICTHISIECREVKIGDRVLFLPIRTLDLVTGEQVTVYFTANIIVEVER